MRWLRLQLVSLSFKIHLWQYEEWTTSLQLQKEAYNFIHDSSSCNGHIESYSFLPWKNVTFWDSSANMSCNLSFHCTRLCFMSSLRISLDMIQLKWTSWIADWQPPCHPGSHNHGHTCLCHHLTGQFATAVPILNTVPGCQHFDYWETVAGILYV